MDHHHSSSDDEDHGHSHRSGEATRYWREPKPLAMTLALFLLLLLFSSLSLSSPNVKPSLGSLSTLTTAVVWHESESIQPLGPDVFTRHLAELDTSCTFRNRTLESLLIGELGMLGLVVCDSIECLWALDLLLPKDIPFAFTAPKPATSVLPSMEGRRVHWTPTGFKSLISPLRPMGPGVEVNTRCGGGGGLGFLQSGSIVPFVPETVCPSCCPLGFVPRMDLKVCIKKELRCSLLTTEACGDDGSRQSSWCELDCQAMFGKELRAQVVWGQTLTTALVTLFLLGLVLGLLFAKLYWVDPLLDIKETLQKEARQRSKGLA